MADPHCDSGLMNISNTSHINAALQAMVHVPQLVCLIYEDEAHRKKCRSLLKCMLCHLFNLIRSMRVNRLGNPAYFVGRWKVISAAMTVEEQRNSYQVLHLFLTRLRLEHVQTHQLPTVENVVDSPLGKLFQGEKIIEDECVVCGTITTKSIFMSVEVPIHINGSLPDMVQQSISLMNRNQICTSCRKMRAVSKKFEVKLPPYLFVYCKWQCSSSFCLPLHMELYGKEFKFHSCIVQYTHDAFLISMCPDNLVRKIRDTQVSFVSIAQLQAPGFLQDSTTTFIYVKVEKPLMLGTLISQVHHMGAVPKSRSHQYKIVNFPKMDDDLFSDLPEGPTNRTVSTQTPTATYKDACLQSDIHEPMVCFQKCKTSKKFQFFTGLTLQDFEALYYFIGGDDVMLRLKLNYRLNTPKKLRQSALSGRDRLFMFLLRLRRGLPLEEMSFGFGISVAYAGEMCFAVTKVLFYTFKLLEERVFISAAHQAKKKPTVMKPFKNLRVLLDGASFMIQTPSNFQQQGNTYSKYKAHSVIVHVFGISCHGSLIFSTPGYEGSMSEKDAIMKSNLLQMLRKGDSVITDRGFDLTAELQKIGVHLYKPPSKGDRAAFTAEEEVLTKDIAAARIYTEHLIAE